MRTQMILDEMPKFGGGFVLTDCLILFRVLLGMHKHCEKLEMRGVG